MGDKRVHREQKSPMNTCAWCNKRIPEDSEVFGLGAKVKPAIKLEDQEGKFIPLSLILTDKTIPAIVTTTDSQAKQKGNDLMFMTCSQGCAESLKEALYKEKWIIDSISMY